VFKSGSNELIPLTTNGKAMVASAGVAVSTTNSSLWQWLGEHHDSITSVCAIIPVIIMVAGLFVTIFRKR